jgi:uncharacterized membrane protein
MRAMSLAVTSYEWFKAFHVLPAVLWVGTNFAFNVLLARIDVAADPKGTAKLLRNIGWVGQRLLAPLSLALLIFGFLMVAKLDWDFPGWIVFGLIVWGYSFLAGAFYVGPRLEPLADQLDAEGYSAAVASKEKTFTLVARVELVLLALVVLDMTLKPG